MRKTSRIACCAAISVLGISLRLIGPVAAQENQPQTASRVNLPPSPLECSINRESRLVEERRPVRKQGCLGHDHGLGY